MKQGTFRYLAVEVSRLGVGGLIRFRFARADREGRVKNVQLDIKIGSKQCSSKYAVSSL
jgi:hypothetical protein